MKNRTVFCGLATGLLVSTFLPSSAEAQPRSVCTSPGFPAPTLCARAGLDTIRATHIVLLDESGSMAPLWPQVKGSLAQFISAIPDGDEVDVRLFADQPRPFLSIPLASAQSKRGALDRLAALAAPNGRHTDLGLAAAAALERISGAPRDRQHFVYILTDGQQDPGSGSPFPANGAGRWPELAIQATTMASARPLSFAVVRLTPSADRSLLVKALPAAVVVDATSEADRAEWIANVVRGVAVAKLKLQLAFELTRPALTIATIRPVIEGNETNGRVTSVRPILLPMLDSVEAGTLPGGQRVKIAVPSGSGGIEAGDTVGVSVGAGRRSWFLPPAGVAESLTVSLQAHTRLTPAEELARIGIVAEAQDDSVRIVLVLAAPSTLDHAKYWGTLLVLVAALVAGLVFLKWKAHRAAFQGELRIRHRDRGEEEVVALSTVSPATYDIVTASQIVARLEARSERGKPVLYVVPLLPNVRLNGRPLTKPQRLPRATALIEHDTMSATYFPTSYNR